MQADPEADLWSATESRGGMLVWDRLSWNCRGRVEHDKSKAIGLPAIHLPSESLKAGELSLEREGLHFHILLRGWQTSIHLHIRR